jgi:tRNA-2-methylthio-N6-dimethylallyladenosine synthase/ribosomal protein S12 methylthiotransferase
MIRVHVLSLGCPKNLVDTERTLGELGEMAFVDSVAEADLAFVNTCGFIQPAVEESVSSLLALAQDVAEAKRRPLLAAAGCLVGRYGVETLAPELPEVDLWLPVRERDEWAERILSALRRKQAVKVGARRLSTGPAYAYLKIAEGCSRSCSFCVIPSIRGPQKSLPVDQVVRQARELLDQGVREIVLVAQDLTAYGRDLGLSRGLTELLEALLPLEGLDWLRCLYLYPAGLDAPLLDFMARAGRPLLPYFDVPLQHADPALLKSMGRPFDRDPRRVVDNIRGRVPDAVIRTSLITGYPGEDETAFNRLKDFVAETRLDHVGVFPFWPEEGARACDLPGQVDEDVRKARAEEVMALQSEISRELLSELVGEEMDILVERPNPEWPGLFEGRIWRQAPEVDGAAYVSGAGLAPGRMVRAVVEQASAYDVTALADPLDGDDAGTDAWKEGGAS